MSEFVDTLFTLPLLIYRSVMSLSLAIVAYHRHLILACVKGLAACGHSDPQPA